MMSHPNLLGLHPESFTSFVLYPTTTLDSKPCAFGEGIAHKNQDPLKRNSAGGTVWLFGRLLPFHTIEDISREVQNCHEKNVRAKYRMFPQGTHEEIWIEDVKSAVVEEEARCPRWKKPRSLWQWHASGSGRTKWRQFMRKVSELERRLEAKRLVEAERDKSDWALSLVAEAQEDWTGTEEKARSVPMGARHVVSGFQREKKVCARQWSRDISHQRNVKTQLRHGRWRFKSGDIKKTEAQCSCLLLEKTKRDPFCDQNSMMTWQQQSTKILREGCESRNNHRYAVAVQVLATQWDPCQTKTSQETEKNTRKFTETVCRRNQKLFTHTISCNLASVVKNDHGIIERLQVIDQRQAELQNEPQARAKEETSAILSQSGSDDKWWLDSMECHWKCLRDDQDLLADGKSQNERRFGESPGHAFFEGWL